MDSDNKKISQLTRVTSLNDSDLFVVTIDPGTTPLTRAITKSNAIVVINPPYPCYTRVSVLTGNPNPTSEESAKTSVFVMPYNGNTYPQWNGTIFVPTTFAELTLSMNAAHTSGSVYDLYVWNDSGTIMVVTGPAWSSATSRGTGAGTAEKETLYGVDVNKVSMTVRNGATTYTMPARYGTLVGTICPSANGQVSWTNSVVSVANKYNMLRKTLTAKDSTNNWNYTTATWREANGSTTNGVARVSFVLSDPVHILAGYGCYAYNATGVYIATGIGIDVTNANSAQIFGGFVPTAGSQVFCQYGGYVSAGSHFVQALEISTATGTTTWSGDAGTTIINGGMLVHIMA